MVDRGVAEGAWLHEGPITPAPLTFTPTAARDKLAALIDLAYQVHKADPIHRSMLRAHSFLEDARTAIEHSMLAMDQELIAIAYCYMGFALQQINGDGSLLEQARGFAQ